MRFTLARALAPLRRDARELLQRVRLAPGMAAVVNDADDVAELGVTVCIWVAWPDGAPGRIEKSVTLSPLQLSSEHRRATLKQLQDAADDVARAALLPVPSAEDYGAECVAVAESYGRAVRGD